MASIFDQAKQAGLLYEVPMNGVQFLLFRQPGQLSMVGSEGFAGCHSVVIICQTCVILAHISPRPEDAPADDLLAGDVHVQKKTDETIALFTTYKAYFASVGGIVAIFSVYKGEVSLPDQKAIILDKLKVIGVAQEQLYVIDLAGLPGKGTVVVDGRTTTPMVYLEDNVIWGGPITPYWYFASGLYKYVDKSRVVAEQVGIPENVWVQKPVGDWGGRKFVLWDGANYQYSA